MSRGDEVTRQTADSDVRSAALRVPLTDVKVTLERDSRDPRDGSVRIKPCKAGKCRT